MTTSDYGLIPLPASAAASTAGASMTTGTPALDQAGLLFHVDGATEATSQWKAETFQLVNWGGFHGPVRFEFHPGATLLSGASGTGKSTLLDAYIALMMPSDVSFNGASNDAVAGRARSTEQRNLLSYLRGQTDTTTDADGQEQAKVLRGERGATWGAVGMTFIDDRRRRFTAFRVYYVPARARRASTDMVMRMATFDGALDLTELQAHIGTSDHFAPKALKAAYPGLKTWDTYSSFANTLHTRLGIGANGDGAKALRLLVRIQSGQQIRTVDELYKEMVLERPATFTKADQAIAHFDDLEDSYQSMQTGQQKADLLEPITGLHARLRDAHAEIATFDTFGLTRDGDTPLTLWALHTETALLEAAVDTNRDARATNTDRLRDARRGVDDLTTEVKTAEDEHRNSGGANLEKLATEIESSERERDDRRDRRSDLAARTSVLAAPLGTLADFDGLQAIAETFLAGYTAATARLRDTDHDLGQQMYPLAQRRSELLSDRASFAGRQGRVPRFLDEMRHQVAQAAGMDAAELPFLAELIDVAPDQKDWRTAIETVLGGSARVLLVPRERLEHFSAAIDPLRLRGRLNFEGVPSHLPHAPSADGARIAGKLLYEDHPFRGWVARHIADPSRNALCVADARDLSGEGYRVTVAGQTRQGSRGSHGRAESANIIGFSSAEAIADIDRQLADLEPQLTRIDEQRRAIADNLAELNSRQGAYLAIQGARWADIDVTSAEQRTAALTAARQAILDSDDRLRALQAHIDGLKGQLFNAQQGLFELANRKKELDREHGTLAERQDDTSIELARVQDDQRVVLLDEQSARLTREFADAVAPADPHRLADFPVNLGRLRQRLMTALGNARTEVTRSETELTRIFEAYQARWEDPNLGRTAASYPDYARVLDHILTTGLHALREEWRRRLTTWSGEDLVPLSGAMDAAIEDIEDRLAPINDILTTLPFGANRDRLRIRLRRLAPEHVAQFRRDLRQLSGAATRGLPDDQLERRFAELQTFMGQMRRRDDLRATAETVDRDRLLDVRRHVEITAERYNADGVLLSTHSALGGKSGGESQELVAFIVGAALRFRLGDELRARPRFAPVFLDEGFVKSDAEFAGRAVQAWKGLGFQLIVGAPLDKVTALEPHMDQLLAITKDTATGYSFVSHMTNAGAQQP